MNPSRPSNGLWAPLPALALFVWKAGFGLREGFYPDDVMNMLGAFRLPWLRILVDPLWPLSGHYRPTGALVYRTLFEAFGLTPLPYHVFAFALIALGLVLLCALACRLCGSPYAGMLAALCGAYHVYLSDLYASTGTLYDQLCFVFFFGALVLDARWRGENRRLGWRRIGVLAVISILAMNSKELGVLLPPLLAVAALLYGKDRIAWRRIDIRLVATLTIISILFLSRSFVFAGEASQFEAYQPKLIGDRVLTNLSHYFGLLFLRPAALNPDQALTIVGLLLGAGIALRNRTVWFGLIIFLLGLTPALLIPARSLYLIYIPMGGLSLAAGAALWQLKDLMPHAPRPAQAVILAILFLAGWIPANDRLRAASHLWMSGSSGVIDTFATAMRKACPTLPKGASVFFADDPFTGDDYIIEMTMQLLYRDPSLHIQRRKRLGSMPDERTLQAIPYVFEFDGREVKPFNRPGA